MTDIDKQVAKVILAGMKKGTSEAKALQDAGLLLTPENKVHLIADALENIAGVLKDTPAQQIIPAGVPLSANDIKYWLAEWIIGVAETNRNALKR